MNYFVEFRDPSSAYGRGQMVELFTSVKVDLGIAPEGTRAESYALAKRFRADRQVPMYRVTRH